MKLQKVVPLHEIQTIKFKDIAISIRFRNQLESKRASARSALALMLCDRSALYHTKKKMSDQQDQLYGATLNAQTAGYGASQIIEIRSKLINPRFVEASEEIIKQWALFLKEIIFAPLLNEEAFQEAKHILLSKIERAMDDPAQYAITKGLKLGGQKTWLGISALGEKDDVMNLTLDDVKQVYQDMMHNDEITMIICGDVQPEWRTFIQDILQFPVHSLTYDSYYIAKNELHDETVTEYKKISQSYIMMTWFTNTSVVDDSFYALRVANAMFGQYSTSLLFQEVREKNSLCYSIFSNLIGYDAALGVTTGVEQKNIDKTIALIKQEFQRLVDGEFDIELLKVSKTMVINSLRASKDAMYSLIALDYQNILLKQQRTTEDIITLIERVSKDDVIQAMKNCELKQTFILTREDTHENHYE